MNQFPICIQRLYHWQVNLSWVECPERMKLLIGTGKSGSFTWKICQNALKLHRYILHTFPIEFSFLPIYFT